MATSVLAIQPHTQAIVAAVVCRDLNHQTTQQLQAELETALAAAPSLSLVLDLAAVEFLPSLAMGMLVNIHKALKKAERRCLLVGIRPLVLQSMQITALDRFFAIHATVDEGLKHV